MTDYIQLFLGVLLLTFVCSYAAWTKFRVVRLRQDLFGIRNRLWDRMRELGSFDDPAHLATRERINAMIRFAHLLNLPMMFFLMIKIPKPAVPAIPSSSDPDTQIAIDEATDASVNCVLSYMVYSRPFSGWLPLRLAGYTISVGGSVASWFKSDGPLQLGATPCH